MSVRLRNIHVFVLTLNVMKSPRIPILVQEKCVWGLGMQFSHAVGSLGFNMIKICSENNTCKDFIAVCFHRKMSYLQLKFLPVIIPVKNQIFLSNLTGVVDQI